MSLPAALALTSAACAASASAAAPLPGTIATLTAATPVSAGDGWVVWSVPAGGRWALEAHHDGTTSELPIAPRSQPFDASVGTNAAGAAVVTFSRCPRSPSTASPNGESPGALIVPASGAGCRIHVVALASGRESALAIPAPAGASDTSPSMWRGVVTFARRAPGHGEVWQVMRWSPRAPRRLETIRHGAIPSYCGGEPCSSRPARGEVQALSSDGSIVTFLWSVEAPGVIGEGAWEERVDSLASGASTLAASGYGHEACTGPVNAGEAEYVWPGAPLAVGASAQWSELEAVGYCFQSFASVLGSHAAGASRSSSATLAEPLLALARDGSTLYGLVPQLPPPTGIDAPACSAAQPCALAPISAPALAPDRYTPAPPFLTRQ